MARSRASDPDQEHKKTSKSYTSAKSIYFMGSETLPSAYTLWGRKRFLLPLRVTGIKTRKNAIVKYLENKNKEERNSRVPRPSDTRYSAKWRYAAAKRN